MMNKYYKVLLAGLVFSIPCLKDSSAYSLDPVISNSNGKLVVTIDKCINEPCFGNFDKFTYTINSDEYTGAVDKDGNVFITSKKDPNISYNLDTIKGNLAYTYERTEYKNYISRDENFVDYNEDGNITRQIDYKGRQPGSADGVKYVEKTYTYDENKNMTSETIRTQMTDRNYNIISDTTETNNYTYTYDGKNNMLTKSVNGELSETYEYDGENKYTYDANHNLIKTEQYHTDVAGGEYTCNHYCTPPEAASAMPDSDIKYSVTVTF